MQLNQPKSTELKISGREEKWRKLLRRFINARREKHNLIIKDFCIRHILVFVFQ